MFLLGSAGHSLLLGHMFDRDGFCEMTLLGLPELALG